MPAFLVVFKSFMVAYDTNRCFPGKRKNSSGRDSNHVNSPESSDSDYSSGASVPIKRAHMESPLNVPNGAPSAHEILVRAFPGHSPSVLELVLKGCNGNVLQAIEVIIQCNTNRPLVNGILGQPHSVPTQTAMEANSQTPPHIPMGNASTPIVKFNYVNGQYRYLVPPSLLPFNSYMLPTPSGMGLRFPQFPVEMQNHQFKPIDGAPEPETGGNNGHGEINGSNGFTSGLCKSCGQKTDYEHSLCENCSSALNRK